MRITYCLLLLLYTKTLNLDCNKKILGNIADGDIHNCTTDKKIALEIKKKHFLC